ncbi:MAG: GNAT family N-acetyltransferase [Flavitalea sp.]
MVIRQEDNEKGGSFYIGEHADRLAELTYTWKDKDILVIEHTEVSDALGGKGIGKQLVKRAVEFAKEKKAKMLVLCPFAKKVIDNEPELRDVLKD